MTLDAIPPAPPGRFGYELAAAPEASGGGEDGASFLENLIDIVNPLQHLPVVSTIYREMTGDGMTPFARVVGGGLYGGVIGFAVAAVNAAIEESSGTDLGGHVMAWLTDDDPGGGDGATQLAANDGPAGTTSGLEVRAQQATWAYARGRDLMTDIA